MRGQQKGKDWVERERGGGKECSEAYMKYNFRQIYTDTLKS